MLTAHTVEPTDALRDSLSHLCAVIERETRALRHYEIDALPSLQDQKREAAESYERELRRLIAGDLALDAEQKTALQQLQNRLSDLLGRNQRALENAHRASSRVVELFVDAARDAVSQEPRPYGNPRQSQPAAPPELAGRRSISINTTL